MLIDVQLRDVTEDDLSIFYEQQLDEEATRMADFPSRAREPFFKHWRKILANESSVNKTIIYQGQVAGNIVCFEQEGERDVGYWIGKSFWRKGIATQALALFLRLIPERPLYAHVAVGNLASQRVLEKCGFRRLSSAASSREAVEQSGEYVYILESPNLIG